MSIRDRNRPSHPNTPYSYHNYSVLPDWQITREAVLRHQHEIDHGSISGLLDDDHPQYLHLEMPRVIKAGHRAEGDWKISGYWSWENALSMGGYRIENLGMPAVGSDAATKAYVDDIASTKTTYSDLWDNMVVSGCKVLIENDDVVVTGGWAYVDGRRVVVPETVLDPATDPGVVGSGRVLVYLNGYRKEGESYAGIPALAQEGTFRVSRKENVLAVINYSATTDRILEVWTGPDLNSIKFQGAGPGYFRDPYTAKMYAYINEDRSERLVMYLADNTAFWPVSSALNLGRTEEWGNRWGTVYAKDGDFSGGLKAQSGSIYGNLNVWGFIYEGGESLQSKYAAAGHNHDNRYYIKEDVDALIVGHDHDEWYYPRGEIDSKIAMTLDDYYTKATINKFLNEKADLDHHHDDLYYDKGTLDAKLSGKADKDHTHSFYDLTSRPTTLAGYGITDAYTKFDVDALIEGHDHDNWYYTKVEVDGLLDLALNDYYTKETINRLLNEKADSDHHHDDLYSPLGHSHAWGDITGKPVYATRWPSWSEVTGKPSTFPPADHTHSFFDLDDTPSTLAGYGITDAYTKAQVNDLLASQVNLPWNVSSPLNGHILQYGNGYWWNVSLEEAGIATTEELDNYALANHNHDSRYARLNATNNYTYGQTVTRPNTTNWCFTSRIEGDTDMRFSVEAGGRLRWGDGFGLRDINLYRGDADLLQTDDTFRAVGLQTWSNQASSLRLHRTSTSSNVNVRFSNERGSVYAGAVIAASERRFSVGTSGDLHADGVFHVNAESGDVFTDGVFHSGGGRVPTNAWNETITGLWTFKDQGIRLDGTARIQDDYGNYKASVVIATRDPTNHDIAEEGTLWCVVE